MVFSHIEQQSLIVFITELFFAFSFKFVGTPKLRNIDTGVPFLDEDCLGCLSVYLSIVYLAEDMFFITILEGKI